VLKLDAIRKKLTGLLSSRFLLCGPLRALLCVLCGKVDVVSEANSRQNLNRKERKGFAKNRKGKAELGAN
jgi:hypothetical protein